MSEYGSEPIQYRRCRYVWTDALVSNDDPFYKGVTTLNRVPSVAWGFPTTDEGFTSHLVLRAYCRVDWKYTGTPVTNWHPFTGCYVGRTDTFADYTDIASNPNTARHMALIGAATSDGDMPACTCVYDVEAVHSTDLPGVMSNSSLRAHHDGSDDKSDDVYCHAWMSRTLQGQFPPFSVVQALDVEVMIAVEYDVLFFRYTVDSPPKLHRSKAMRPLTEGVTVAPDGTIVEDERKAPPAAQDEDPPIAPRLPVSHSNLRGSEAHAVYDDIPVLHTDHSGAIVPTRGVFQTLYDSLYSTTTAGIALASYAGAAVRTYDSVMSAHRYARGNWRHGAGVGFGIAVDASERIDALMTAAGYISD